jgi:hypothetical protein
VNQRFVFLCVAAAAAISAASLCAQNRTTVRDTLYNADGSRTAGQVEITWNGFRSADGKTIAAGKITRRITDGVLDLALVPNAGTTPAGTSYAVTYLLASGLSYSETWAVPQSDTPVSLAAVRVSVAPSPAVLVAQQQISEGAGMGVLLDFYRAASATATGAGQCYWNTTANALYCSTGTGAWQNYAPGTPAAHAGTHASNGADPLGINASQITSGTLADSLLPATIAGDKTFNGSVGVVGDIRATSGATPLGPESYAQSTFTPSHTKWLMNDEGDGDFTFVGDVPTYLATVTGWGDLYQEPADLAVALEANNSYRFEWTLQNVTAGDLACELWGDVLFGTIAVANGTTHLDFTFPGGYPPYVDCMGATGGFEVVSVSLKEMPSGNLRVDKNLYVAGNLNLLGSINLPVIGAVRYADQYSGADAGAKIAAAIADLPSTGGTVDARGFEGTVYCSGFTVDRPVRLLIGAAFLDLAGPIVIATNGKLTLEGLGAYSSCFMWGNAGFAIDTFDGDTVVSDVQLRNFCVYVYGSGTGGIRVGRTATAFDGALLRARWVFQNLFLLSDSVAAAARVGLSLTELIAAQMDNVTVVAFERAYLFDRTNTSLFSRIRAHNFKYGMEWRRNDAPGSAAEVCTLCDILGPMAGDGGVGLKIDAGAVTFNGLFIEGQATAGTNGILIWITANGSDARFYGPQFSYWNAATLAKTIQIDDGFCRVAFHDPGMFDDPGSPGKPITLGTPEGGLPGCALQVYGGQTGFFKLLAVNNSSRYVYHGALSGTAQYGTATANYEFPGNVTVGGTLTANASSATALAADPADCGGNNFALGIAANGTATCAQPSASNLSDGTTGSGAVVLATAPIILVSLTRTNATGDIQLLTSSATYQFIDPNGSNRNCDTPQTPGTGRGYVVKNIGTANTIAVRVYGGGTTLVTLTADDTATVIYDGTAWQVI